MNNILETDEKKAMDAAITDAAKEWIHSFTRIPKAIVEKLYQAGDTIIEVTPTEGEDFDTSLPKWGTMWSFSNILDEAWLDDDENRKVMADCGFRIYEQEDYGYIFGIDGAGYDFYEAHWIPLYKARGLKWHLEPFASMVAELKKPATAQHKNCEQKDYGKLG